MSKKEASQMKTSKNRYRSVVRAEIEAMEVGQVMLLERAEWTRKSQSPTTLVLDICRSTKRTYTCERLIDNSGWLIERQG